MEDPPDPRQSTTILQVPTPFHPGTQSEYPKIVNPTLPHGHQRPDRTFEILLRSMHLLAAMNLQNAEAYRALLRLAEVVSSLENVPIGAKLYQNALKDLEQYLSTIPNRGPPAAA